MQLVEIKDLRNNQIYDFGNNIFGAVGHLKLDGVVAGHNFSNFFKNGNFYYHIDNIEVKNKLIDKTYKLIGFLDITHKIVDNKLIEIKRKKIEIDDIVNLCGRLNIVTDTYHDKKYYYADLLDQNGLDSIGISSDDFEKIGILGVTHEFINDKLAK